MKTALFSLILFALFWLVFSLNTANAHGSVTPDEDLCVIKIGFYSAHFKIYQPQTRQHQDYCEDLPDSGETIFVMEYSYGDLGEVPVDFRIIRDITGLGRFAKIEDVQALDPVAIEQATEVYRPPVRQPDVFTLIHDFEDEGNFLGIVTARHPETNELYLAVFPFEVGYVGFGYLPLFVLIIVLIQGVYWWMDSRNKTRTTK